MPRHRHNFFKVGDRVMFTGSDDYYRGGSIRRYPGPFRPGPYRFYGKIKAFWPNNWCDVAIDSSSDCRRRIWYVHKIGCELLQHVDHALRSTSVKGIKHLPDETNKHIASYLQRKRKRSRKSKSKSRKRSRKRSRRYFY